MSVTVQINFSPGDIAYAAQVAPVLLSAHPTATERLAIIDCCRPGKTRIVDPDQRFPLTDFQRRSEEIIDIVQDLKNRGLLDRVEVIKPSHAVISDITNQYLRKLVHETHDYGACALMSYFAAIELCRTPYLLHYDADILLHSEQGYDWSEKACSVLKNDESIFAVIPRLSAPSPGGDFCDRPSRHEFPVAEQVSGGWRDRWFSTRCFLVDCQRLKASLPLLRGKTYYEVLLKKYLGHAYPYSPERMLSIHLEYLNKFRFILNDDEAWYIHPPEKGSRFIELLPTIQASIADGKLPREQYVQQELYLDLWQNWSLQRGAS